MKSPKPCRVCKEEFEISEASLKKGNYICKPCRKVDSAANLASRKARGMRVSGTKMPREWHQEYEKEYFKRPEVRRRRVENFYQRLQDPTERMKRDAREQVRNAVRRGDLERLPCEVCGALPSQGHHEDYEKPLDVMWLCRTHHTELHNKARGENQ